MPLDLANAVIPGNFDDALAKQRVALVASDADFQARVSRAAQTVMDSRRRMNKVPLSEQLATQEIASDAKPRIQGWIERFHQAADWQARSALVDGFYKEFEEDIKKDETLRRFPRFAARIVFDNAPDALSPAQQENMNRHIAVRMLNPDLKAPYMTIARARKELTQIEFDRASGKEKWKDVTDTQIRSLKLYYTALEKEFLPYLAQNDNTPVAQAPVPAPKKANGDFKPK